jgi:UDP-GlcNAc:undecaprenyl-phosphate/decaprenyl-phosphate GlcNAc-1-phosphate transferase
LVTPILILGIPIFDTLFVMYIRFLRGLPIFLGSPDHTPIRLRRWGLSVRQVVLLSYLSTAFLGTIGIIVIMVERPVALSLVGITVTALIVLAVVLKRVDTDSSRPGVMALRSRMATGHRGEKVPQ